MHLLLGPGPVSVDTPSCSIAADDPGHQKNLPQRHALPVRQDGVSVIPSLRYGHTEETAAVRHQPEQAELCVAGAAGLPQRRPLPVQHAAVRKLPQRRAGCVILGWEDSIFWRENLRQTQAPMRNACVHAVLQCGKFETS